MENNIIAIEEKLKEKYKDLPLISLYFDTLKDPIIVRGISVFEWDKVVKEAISRTKERVKNKEITLEEDVDIDPDVLEDIFMRDFVLYPDYVYENYKNEDFLVGIPDTIITNIDNCSGNNGAMPIAIEVLKGLYLKTELDELLNENKIDEVKYKEEINKLPERNMVIELSEGFSIKEHYPTMEEIDNWIETYSNKGKPVYFFSFHNTCYVYRGFTQRELKHISEKTDKLILDLPPEEKQDDILINEIRRNTMLDTFVLFPKDFKERRESELGMPANIPNMAGDGIWTASQWNTEVKTRYINA